MARVLPICPEVVHRHKQTNGQSVLPICPEVVHRHKQTNGQRDLPVCPEGTDLFYCQFCSINHIQGKITTHMSHFYVILEGGSVDILEIYHAFFLVFTIPSGEMDKQRW